MWEKTPQSRVMAYGEMFGFTGPRTIHFPKYGKFKFEGPGELKFFGENRWEIYILASKVFSIPKMLTLHLPAGPWVYFVSGPGLTLQQQEPFYGELFFHHSPLREPHSEQEMEEYYPDTLWVASRRRTLSRRFESQRLPLVNSAGGVHWISGRPATPPGRRRPARFAGPLHGSGHSG